MLCASGYGTVTWDEDAPSVISPAIVVERLRVIRGGALVLDDLSLAVREGCVTGLLGPSGSGKSTLMRSIVGVQRIQAGTITVLGNPAGTASLRARLGYRTQAPSVYEDLSVQENLNYFARILDAPREQVGRVIETVRLTRLASRTVARLSGGERARVSLAAALIGDPDVLILDEPTVGLDPVLRRDLWNTFHDLAAERKTLLVSSHVMDEAERCDELLLLREGGLLASGTPAALRRQTGAPQFDEVFLRLIESAR
jgi:ABC-2 type transport system ATP-binding protein